MDNKKFADFIGKYALSRTCGASKESACKDLSDEDRRSLTLNGINTVLSANMDSPVSVALAHVLSADAVIDEVLKDEHASAGIIDDFIYNIVKTSARGATKNISVFVDSLLNSGEEELVNLGKEMINENNKV